MGGERGQAAVEWVGLVLLSTLALGALATAVPLVDGRSLGGLIAHRVVCAARGGCDDGDARLAGAYGDATAALVRAHAPGLVYEPGEAQLPVDWRRCRARRCADARDDRDLDTHRSHGGERATVFTRVVRRGGRTYLQYWFYFPDSNTALAGSDKAWNAVLGRIASYPGFHADDWEGHQVRIDPDGDVLVRSTTHGGWQWCKRDACKGRWGPETGWTRVSRGSHSGHVPTEPDERNIPAWPGGQDRVPLRMRFRGVLPGRGLHERTTTAGGIRLVPLEGIDRRRYRRRAKGVSPPWDKGSYRNPEDPSS